MTAPAAIRRTILVLGVIATLGLAAATVEAASRWTAASAPLVDGPASIDLIQAALAAQQSRSAVLEEQLAAMRSASDDLAAALSTANDQVSSDQATADELRAALAISQAKLAKLEAALKAQAAAGPLVGRTAGGPTAAPPPVDDGGIDD